MIQIIRHKHSRLSSEGGFTIVEALIAVIIFIITLSGSLAIYIHSDRITTLATHKRLAVEIANLRMEEFRSMSYTTFAGLFPLADPAVPETFADVVPGPNVGDLQSVRTVTIANVPPVEPPDYKEVTVNVGWTESDWAEAKGASVQTIIAP